MQLALVFSILALSVCAAPLAEAQQRPVVPAPPNRQTPAPAPVQRPNNLVNNGNARGNSVNSVNSVNGNARANVGNAGGNTQPSGANQAKLEADLQRLKKLADRATNEHGKIDRTEQRLDADQSTRNTISRPLQDLRTEDQGTHDSYNQLVAEVRSLGYTKPIQPPQMGKVPHTQRTAKLA